MIKKTFCIIVVIVTSALSMFSQDRGNQIYHKGYRPSVQLGYAFDEGDSYWSLETSHGYSFGNGLYVGGGAGLHWGPDEGRNLRDVWMGAVFGDVKYSFMNRLVSPFAGARIGAFYDMREKNVGTMLRPYAGVDIWRISLSVALDQHLMRDDHGHYCLWHIQIAYNF